MRLVECALATCVVMLAVWTGSAPAQAQAYRPIVAAKHTGMCIDIAGGSTAVGGSVVQWYCHGAQHQQIQLEEASSGQYRIRASHSNLCLEVANGAVANGAYILQGKCDDQQHQLWRVSGTGDNVKFTAVHSGQCMGIYKASTSAGAQLAQYPCSDANSQKWRAVALDLKVPADPVVTANAPIIAAKHSGMCIDVAGGSYSVGGSVVQWRCNGARHQQLRLEEVWSGEYRIRASHSNLCLGVGNGSIGNGAYILQGKCDDRPHQLWKITGSGDNVKIAALHTGKCMAIYKASTSAGARLAQYSCSNTNSQKWRVSALGLIPPVNPILTAYAPIVAAQHTGMCIDVAGGSYSVGGSVVQWRCNGARHQQLRLEEVWRGQFRIRASHSNLCLQVGSGATANGAYVLQGRCDDRPHQLWQIAGTGDNVEIIATHNGKCMGIYGGSSSAGARIAQYSCNGAASQKWRVEAFNVSATAPSKWDGPYQMPLIPVAVANLPDGRILTWSAYDRFNHTTDDLGMTYTSIFDPATGRSSERLVTNTKHDMFCPGLNTLADGRILVNGGSSSDKTSIYSPITNSWYTDAPMSVPRGYQGNAVLQDGSVLTLGGSWSGGLGGKYGEVWSPGDGWRYLKTSQTRRLGPTIVPVSTVRTTISGCSQLQMVRFFTPGHRKTCIGSTRAVTVRSDSNDGAVMTIMP